MSEMGFVLFVFSALTSGTVNASDWMSMVQPTEYFKSRNIDSKLDRLIDLAIADIDTPKAQIRQLTALQHFIVESQAFKNAKNYETNRLAIEEIARGERGKDPAGFGQEFAKRLLTKLDGKAVEIAKQPSLRRDALNWFPSELKMGLAFDMVQIEEYAAPPRNAALAKLSEYTKSHLYDQLESAGNLHLTRMAFGIVDAETVDDQKLILRVTGRGNQAWVAQAVSKRFGGSLERKDSKAADGATVISLTNRNSGWTMLLIGNTDIIVACYQKYEGKHEDVAAEVLAVRAKQKPHATDGPLKDRLAKIPDRALGFAVGDLPRGLREATQRELDPVPAKIAAFVERGQMGLEWNATMQMQDAAEAGKLVAKIGTVRKDGIDALQKALNDPKSWPGFTLLPLQDLIKLIDTTQSQNQGAKVDVRAFMQDNMVRQISERFINRNTTEPSSDPNPKMK